jgi:sodium-dependent dicarboxylate transporter 2/3/5
MGVIAFLKARSAALVATLLIGSVVCLYLSGLLRQWGIPEAGQVALVILVTAAVLWITEAVPLFVTSLIILFLSLIWLGPMLEGNGAEGISKATWTAPFFSDVVLLFLGGFVLAAGLHKYQLDEQMARTMVRKSRGELPRLIAAIIAVTAFLSMWLSNTATAAMMLTLVLPIVQKLPAGSAPRRALILAVPFAANAGGLGTPIGSPPNAIAMEYLRSIGQAPTFAGWMLAAVPIELIMLVFLWYLLVYGYRANGRVDGVDCEALKLNRSAGRITVLIVAVVTVAGWLTSGWHGLSSGTIALIPVILIFGIGLLKVRDLQSLSWDVLLLMGGGLCLGTVLGKSGLPEWLIAQLHADQWQAFGLMAVLAIAACAISSLMSNTATANLMMPMILGLTIEAKSPILLGVAFACSLAMALPISTPPNAMAFSSGELRVADVLKPGLLISAIGLAFVLTIGYWWWGLVGFR